MQGAIHKIDYKVEEKLRILSQLHVDIKQENNTYRSNLNVTIGQLVDNRVEILEKNVDEKIKEL